MKTLEKYLRLKSQDIPMSSEEQNKQIREFCKNVTCIIEKGNVTETDNLFKNVTETINILVEKCPYFTKEKIESMITEIYAKHSIKFY